MEKCHDHPTNMAVETCRKCERLICGFHDSALCEEHLSLSKRSDKPLLVLAIIIGSAVIFFLMGVIVSFLNQLTYLDGGIDYPRTSTSGSTELPGLMTVSLIFFTVAIPILILTSLIMVKLSDQNINLGLRSKKVIDQSTSDIYYCQRCGQELDLSDDQCVRCGKNTDEEKNLVS